MHEQDPVKRATSLEASVRKAFLKIYGKPSDPEYVQRAIRSSYLEAGKKLGWTEAHPDVVLVLTEFGWIEEPYSSTEDRYKWDQVKEVLKKEGWDASWDSINPAVQMIYLIPKQHSSMSMGADSGGEKPVAKLALDTRAHGPYFCSQCDAENEDAILMTDAQIVCPECGTPIEDFQPLYDAVVSAAPIKKGDVNTKDWHCCDDKCRAFGCRKR